MDEPLPSSGTVESQAPSSDGPVPDVTATASVTPAPESIQPTPPAPAASPSSPTPPLTYEETPIIEPIKDPPASTAPTISPSLPKPRKGLGKIIGNIVVFVLLFCMGIWLSMYVRQFLPTGFDLSSVTPGANPTPVVTGVPTQDSFADWKTYAVVNGITRQPIQGISFKLPSDVLYPVCDGTACVSQGTYLPGGTRFTVAARGVGQSLPDSRGSILVDTTGKQFVSHEATVSGALGVEFTANFSGSTLGGYTFTRIHGYMLYATPQVTIEMSHFVPQGVSADFDKDEALFQKIVSTLEAPVFPTPSLVPSITRAPVSTSSAQ